MSKESIVQDFATLFCGHKDQVLLRHAESICGSLGELHQFAREVDPDIDLDLEGMTDEERREYLQLKLADFVWDPEGDRVIICPECDQEKLRR